MHVTDVTSRSACFALWGPRAPDVLPSLDVPFFRWRDVTIGDVPVRAYGVSFAGEKGWELYCPMEFGLRLWETLWELGQPHGVVAGGYRAIDSLRLEKGFRVWGADITEDVSPAEAGLAKGDTERKLACLLLDDPRSVALGNEPVRAGGEVVGRVTSGGYGYTVEKSIAYALLPVRRRRTTSRSRSSASGSARASAPSRPCDRDDRARVDAHRVRRLRRAAGAHRAAARAVRRAPRVDRGARVRGRARGVQPAARPGLDAAGDLQRVAGRRPGRCRRRRARLHPARARR